jgi:glutamine---fructose-6-phosphate transaminase (isomerizing)
MCGIVGYVGNKPAQPFLLDSLKRLEYRGYDSCGIAVHGSGITVVKDAVRVEALQQSAPCLKGRIGIGHTRWATHGVPSAKNAHPHTDCTGKIAVVHNGVISNYQELKESLLQEKHIFRSDTDTEVIAHVIEKYYHGDIVKAVEQAKQDLQGSYAIAVISEDDDLLLVARKDSPLIIGLGDGENYIASDVPAVLDYTNKVIYLENDDIGIISDNQIVITQKGEIAKREIHTILWDREDIRKSGYEHFMLKEIHEQPRVIREMTGQSPLLDPELMSELSLVGAAIIACGTSYHAGLIGKYIIENTLGIPVGVEIASEFSQFQKPLPIKQGIVITQSGETADVLLSVNRLHEVGAKTLVITNVIGSTASRVSDRTIFTRAGPEISVAATKSFIAQLIALYQLALSSPEIDRNLLGQLILELRQLPALVQLVLDRERQIIDCAKYLSAYNNVFFIGRGINYPVALEGALKLKEISYIHAEGYAAGELKHGPFALLTRNTPVVAIVPMDHSYKSMLTSIKEVKARSSPIIALADEKDENIRSLADVIIKVPHTGSLFSPVVNAISLQLLAYYTANFLACPIDFPRNLAKSVTVE